MAQNVTMELVRLCHALGDPAQELVIYGEGDAGARVDGKLFLVKAAERSLGELEEGELVEVAFGPLLELVEKKPNAHAATVKECLQVACGMKSPMPSREAFFHAVLLDLPGVKFVGHTHPTYLCGIMASPRAEAFASMRLFPQQVHLCGPRSLFVPYMDPGLPLAAELRYRLEQYLNQYGDPPRTILLGNHGMIALGATVEEVLASTNMMQKAGRAYVMAQMCGGVLPIPEEQVQRLVGK